MAYWLVKSEPGTWSWEQHAKAGPDAWTGVRNHQAKLHLKAMKTGERALFYHSGEDKEVVGITEVVKEAYVDPTDVTGKFFCVDFKAVEPFKQAVSLGQAKAEPKLAGMVLVNNSRLSVQPVTAAEWAVVTAMGGLKG
jgi:predicted RNA-binding protein with PUA-like domain